MKTVAVVNLGCKVNRCECDALAGLFVSKGYNAVSGFKFADIYIVNTCAVTAEAERKSRQAVARCLKKNPTAEIRVIGCASQNNAEQFLGRDNVKYVAGTDNKYKTECEKKNILPITNRRRAYVKIQDGCDNFCAYCLIPYLRGRSRSRETARIVAECEKLAKTTDEILLTGINISDFKPALSELIGALVGIKAKFGLGSLEMSVIDEDLLTALSALHNFNEQFHLSLQSGDDGVLRDMNRHYTSGEYLERIKLIRNTFPRAIITTDVLVGFPTESDDAFENTLDVIRRARFSSGHVFCYSKREGTSAAKLTSVVSDATAKERAKRAQGVIEDEKQNQQTD